MYIYISNSDQYKSSDSVHNPIEDSKNIGLIQFRRIYIYIFQIIGRIHIQSKPQTLNFRLIHSGMYILLIINHIIILFSKIDSKFRFIPFKCIYLHIPNHTKNSHLVQIADSEFGLIHLGMYILLIITCIIILYSITDSKFRFIPFRRIYLHIPNQRKDGQMILLKVLQMNKIE